MSEQFANTARKVFGDRRDKAAALHESGFENEAAVAQWAGSITTEPLAEVTGPIIIKQILTAVGHPLRDRA